MPETVFVLGVVVYVAVRNILGFSTGRLRRIVALVAADLAVQLLIIAIGLVTVFDPALLVEQVDLWSAPTAGGLVFALTLATDV